MHRSWCESSTRRKTDRLTTRLTDLLSSLVCVLFVSVRMAGTWHLAIALAICSKYCQVAALVPLQKEHRSCSSFPVFLPFSMFPFCWLGIERILGTVHCVAFLHFLSFLSYFYAGTRCVCVCMCVCVRARLCACVRAVSTSFSSLMRWPPSRLMMAKFWPWSTRSQAPVSRASFRRFVW